MTPPRREADTAAPRPASFPSRRRTETQLRNAEKLLDAMVAETDRHGLDDLRSARVAKAAHLTTGALYSRFENADEMLVVVVSAALYVPPSAVQAAVKSATLDDVDTRFDTLAAASTALSTLIHSATSSLSSRPDAAACHGT